MEEAAVVAARAIGEVSSQLVQVKLIEICCFDTSAKNIYSEAFSN
jgi:hypothetical protein